MRQPHQLLLINGQSSAVYLGVVSSSVPRSPAPNRLNVKICIKEVQQVLKVRLIPI